MSIGLFLIVLAILAGGLCLAVLVRHGWAGLALPLCFVFGSRGQDRQKLALVEGLRSTLQPGMTVGAAKAAFSELGINHVRSPRRDAPIDEQARDVPEDARAYDLVGIVLRTRWQPLHTTSIGIYASIEDDLVRSVEFRPLIWGL